MTPIPNPYREGMSPRNFARETAAIMAAQTIRDEALIFDDIEIGLVLGTGWGDALSVENAYRNPFYQIPGFDSLGKLAGHARELVIGFVAGKRVAILRGRVHMNEDPFNPNIPKMVRLQTDLLMHLGVRKLVVTSAVGSLGGRLRVGDVGVADGFCTFFAGTMPLWAGEFCSPEDTLDPDLRLVALQARNRKIKTKAVGHIMVRGPHFEGRKYDKGILAGMGLGMVGMSMLPEACVAALYDCKVLGLGFTTDDDVEECTHEVNLARARAASPYLGILLERIVAKL